MANQLTPFTPWYTTPPRKLKRRGNRGSNHIQPLTSFLHKRYIGMGWLENMMQRSCWRALKPWQRQRNAQQRSYLWLGSMAREGLVASVKIMCQKLIGPGWSKNLPLHHPPLRFCGLVWQSSWKWSEKLEVSHDRLGCTRFWGLFEPFVGSSHFTGIQTRGGLTKSVYQRTFAK